MRATDKYTMSPLIRKYYESWWNGTTLFDHPNDVERFYRFTKACLRYGRKPVNGQWLRFFLERDLFNRDDIEEKTIQYAVSLFDNLIDFSKTSFPNHLLEMRNPYLVADELRSIYRRHGDLRYPEKEINDIIKKKLGSNWKKIIGSNG